VAPSWFIAVTSPCATGVSCGRSLAIIRIKRKLKADVPTAGCTRRMRDTYNIVNAKPGTGDTAAAVRGFPNVRSRRSAPRRTGPRNGKASPPPAPSTSRSTPTCFADDPFSTVSHWARRATRGPSLGSPCSPRPSLPAHAATCRFIYLGTVSPMKGAKHDRE
jgi:hypothetical protein